MNISGPGQWQQVIQPLSSPIWGVVCYIREQKSISTERLSLSAQKTHHPFVAISDINGVVLELLTCCTFVASPACTFRLSVFWKIVILLNGELWKDGLLEVKRFSWCLVSTSHSDEGHKQNCYQSHLSAREFSAGWMGRAYTALSLVCRLSAIHTHSRERDSDFYPKCSTI